MPLLRRFAKKVAGMAPERSVPRFAPRTFREWFARRPRTMEPTGRRVILWTDTFNDHFHPGTLAAAVDVLEAAGCDVEITPQRLCCGRPLYDYGMLDEAERRLRGIIDTLRSDIEAGVPIVGLEPSCVAVFRDELGNLLADHPLAAPLKQNVRTLAEYLKVIDYTPPPLTGKAIRHGHCHHKAVMHMDADDALLTSLGLEWKDSGAGCCGMAGSFGFEDGKYELSREIGEHTLLPAVRTTPADSLIIADGFSCREQIIQETGRRPLHTAEVLQLAVRGRPADGDAGREVRELEPSYLSSRKPHALPVIAAAGALAVVGGILSLRRTRRRKRRRR